MEMKNGAEVEAAEAAEAVEAALPSIPEWLAGKSVLVTGGTGFLGKALMEKLLRSCPGLSHIYVLMRPKRGLRLAQRLDVLIDDPLYDRLKKEQPDLVLEKKIIPLAGDISELDLGLSKEDRQLITENVHVIFHVAASVRFDDPLREAVLLNVRGTREVCKLVHDTTNLQAYIHVSTAFANCDRPEAREVLYPPKADWRRTIELAEKCDQTLLTILSDKYIGNMPNTYCFTKNVAEHVVHDLCHGKVPFRIFRPSIVFGSLRDEPIAGWVDNFNGPIGVCVAYGKGIMRTVYAHADYKPDYIPVDVVTKALVVSAWDVAVQRDRGVAGEVIQCTSHSADWLRPSISRFADVAMAVSGPGGDLPFNGLLWVPTGHTTTSTTVAYIRTVFTMLLPSLLLDTVLKCMGKKPRLMHIQKKMYVAQLALRHFMNNEWVYPNDELLALQRRILPQDAAAWDYEFMHHDLEQYIRQCALGCRRFLLQEPDHTLPAARRHLARMYWAHVALRALFMCLALALMWRVFGNYALLDQ